MDTERYQALMDTLEQIKSRAEECQDVMCDGDATAYSIKFNLERAIKLCHSAIGQAAEVFRAEEVEA